MLIERGHDRASVWLSTPRQIAALLRASDRAHNRRLADAIYTGRLAHHGKDNAVKDAVKRLQKGG
jgi:pyridoxal/pyridoxine/pyridoxamine kinase